MTIRKHAREMFLLSALSFPVAALADPTYTVTFLPSHFTGYDINNAGQVVGNTRTEAWIWSNSGIVNLSDITPGVQAYAINNRGQAAGSIPNPVTGGSSAFIYSQGQIRDIGGPAGLNTVTPRAINDNGQVAGTAGRFPGETSRAFFYNAGAMTAIDTFGGEQGDGYGLNNSGTVVGANSLAPEPDRPRGDERAFFYRNGTLTQIVSPGTVPLNAHDVNDAGAIIGWESVASGDVQPFLYAGGVVKHLGGPSGAAYGINNKGAIVGAWNPNESHPDLTHAFLYRAGTFSDLNDLIVPQPGWTVTGAEDINDAGQILATACFGSLQDCRSVRLDLVPAVPEPANIAMLLGGLMTLAGIRRQRK